MLAFNGAHGSLTTLGKFDCGIEIYLSQLNSVQVAADGQTATIGGGTLAINVTNELWAVGKQTGKPMALLSDKVLTVAHANAW